MCLLVWKSDMTVGDMYVFGSMYKYVAEVGRYVFSCMDRC